MPFRVGIDPAESIVYVEGEGSADADVVESEIRKLASHPEFRPEMGVLCNLRDLEYVPSLEDARRFARLYTELRSAFRGRTALVVQGTARYGVARMVSQFVELRGVSMAAFTDPVAAKGWLCGRGGEIPPPSTHPGPDPEGF